ncbi:MAG: ABC transporter permease [Acidimicrobiales bacterium]
MTDLQKDVPSAGTTESVTGAPGAEPTAITPGGGTIATVSPPGAISDFWRRFLRNRLAVVGLVMIVLVILSAIFASSLAPHNPYTQDLSATLRGPSAKHPFGTDQNGRDQLSRVLYGTRIAIKVGLASIFLSLLIGIIMGSLAGYLGGAWDSLIMRIADVFFAFPLLIGAILIILVLGRGISSVILALAIFSWATSARLLRSSILSVRENEYIEAARSLGASRWRIVTRHVLPNSLAPVIVYGAVSVGVAIVAEVALAYLGAGPNANTPDWGNLIAAGQGFLGYKDFMWFFPSLAVVFTVLGFVFMGDGIRDALDPKLR